MMFQHILDYVGYKLSLFSFNFGKDISTLKTRWDFFLNIHGQKAFWHHTFLRPLVNRNPADRL